MVTAPHALIAVSSPGALIAVRTALESQVRMLQDLIASGPAWPNGDQLLRDAQAALAAAEHCISPDASR